jgi:hypothetical protein
MASKNSAVVVMEANLREGYFRWAEAFRIRGSRRRTPRKLNLRARFGFINSSGKEGKSAPVRSGSDYS